MNRSWYIWGFITIIFGLLIFQLIWLPAPFFFGSGKEWIQYINQLYYAVILIPLFWLVGAVVRSKQSIERNIGIMFLRIITIVGSIVSIVLLMQPLQYIILLLVTVVITAISIIVELFWSKWIAIKSNHQLESKQRKHSYSSLIQSIIMYVILLLILLCPTGYKVTYPGMTMDMNAYATIGSKTSKDLGIIEGVLVFDRPAFPIDWLYSAIFPAYHIEKQSENELSISETYSQVVTMKSNANQLAAAVALERAGLGEAIIFDGVQIMAIVAQSPADGIIQAGDIVTAINNEPLSDATALIQYMRDHITPGEDIQVELLREGKQVEYTLPTIASSDDEHRAIIGISVQDAYTTRVEQKLTFQSYIAHFGGPSHGAMLTLAFLDQLTDGDLTGGLKIAGTGTIEPDGSVGMVGGIAQKAYAVSLTSADVFFVPEAGMLEATNAAPKLTIVPVTSLNDILLWINNHKPENKL